MILTELRKLFRRPRTWMALFLLDALPTVVAIFVAVTKVGPRPGEGPAFLSAVLSNGALFPAAALALLKDGAPRKASDQAKRTSGRRTSRRTSSRSEAM